MLWRLMRAIGHTRAIIHANLPTTQKALDERTSNDRVNYFNVNAGFVINSLLFDT